MNIELATQAGIGGIKLVDLATASRPRGITWSRDGTAVIIANQERMSDIVLFELER